MNTNEVFRALQRVMTENPWDGRLTRELQLVERLKALYPGVEVRDFDVWDCWLVRWKWSKYAG